LRVRAPLGRRRDRPPRDDELWRLMESGDYSAETMDRIAELLGQHGPKWPPDRPDKT
jgi:hypothetical protein